MKWCSFGTIEWWGSLWPSSAPVVASGDLNGIPMIAAYFWQLVCKMVCTFSHWTNPPPLQWILSNTTQVTRRSYTALIGFPKWTQLQAVHSTIILFIFGMFRLIEVWSWNFNLCPCRRMEWWCSGKWAINRFVFEVIAIFNFLLTANSSRMVEKTWLWYFNWEKVVAMISVRKSLHNVLVEKKAPSIFKSEKVVIMF